MSVSHIFSLVLRVLLFPCILITRNQKIKRSARKNAWKSEVEKLHAGKVNRRFLC